MARCNDTTCTCIVRGGVGVSIAGAGTAASPYIVQIDQQGRVAVLDTATVDLHLTGAGTSDDPGVISADLTAHLGDLLDVAKGVPTSGYVLAWTGSQWAPVPPATAAPGAIAVSRGITGDGSSGAPITAVADATGGLVVNPGGMALSQGTLDRLTNLETKRFDPQYLRAERTDTLNLVDATWTRPASMNLGATKVVGARLSYAGGYITCLDAGVYAWQATATWAQMAAQTSPSNQSCAIEKNDVQSKYGQRTDWVYADDIIGAHRSSYNGTIDCNANDRLRLAFYQNNPSSTTGSVVPESFIVYRVA